MYLAAGGDWRTHCPLAEEQQLSVRGTERRLRARRLDPLLSRRSAVNYINIYYFKFYLSLIPPFFLTWVSRAPRLQHELLRRQY